MGFGLRCGIYVWASSTEISKIYASASSSSPIQSVKSSDRSPSLQTKPCSSPSLSPSTPLFSPSPSTAFSFGGTRLRCLRLVTSCVASVQNTVANGSAPAPVVVEREQIRNSLPIKGRMAADTIDLLKVNGVSVPMKICILIIIWYGKDSVVWMDSDSNSDTDTDSEKDDENEARRYLSRGKKQPVPFSHKFSKADPLALRLLERLLAFDPKDRASAEDVLSDPYFSGLSNSEREPSTQPISKLEFDFERKKLTNDDVRELIYREILEYHPQMLEEYKHGGDQLSFMYPRCYTKLVSGRSLIDHPILDEVKIARTRHVMGHLQSQELGSNLEVSKRVNVAMVTKAETMTTGEIYAYIKQESAKVKLELYIPYSIRNA
ncbi:hypothetical protein IGI04_020220 [Brassica rapa subsp. trilocularis]|uniref:Protein kinase domain-containing protein n=1 Tax=Brassica rapa subsp. trilocularis TaxID=1813537 RepID=A0ABQ7MLG2_BRACM|nr:hypothetical protein IGI04_020220 [Brassica rapa subsp. trilocularis]